MIRALLLASSIGITPSRAEKPIATAEHFPAVQGNLFALVQDSPNETIVQAFPGTTFPRLDPSTDEATIKSAALAFLEPAPSSISLKIDWLDQTAVTAGFTRSVRLRTGLVHSRFQQGSSHITRTVLASEKDDAIFIHILSDKPGELSFRATLTSSDIGATIIEDRRQLVWTASKGPAARARAWVIPFESDVGNENGAIILRGEGECLLILYFEVGERPAKSISATLDRLAAAHDPGQTPPDPSRIWQAVLANANARSPSR